MHASADQHTNDRNSTHDGSVVVIRVVLIIPIAIVIFWYFLYFFTN